MGRNLYILAASPRPGLRAPLVTTAIRSLFIACLSIATLTLSSCGPSIAVPITSSSNIWVVAWGAPPENASPTAENGGGVEQSFRFFLYPTTSGTMERLRFSNFFGATPITIASVRLAVATTPPAIDANRDSPVLFAGLSSITIAPGAEVISDPVNIPYTFGEKLAVSTYMQGTFPPLTQHESQSMINYISTANTGDKTTDSTGASFTLAVTEWYLLTAMDVYGQYQGTVALLGSSTIDGHNSNFGDTNAYPVANVAVPGQDDDRPSDILARTLNAAGFNYGVFNAGILGDFAGPGTGSPTGSSGVDRIGRDVLHQPSVKIVLIYLGQVDLRNNSCRNATDVEGYLRNMVSQAHTAGVKVILATIPPASYCTSSTSPNAGPYPSPGNPYAGDINPGPENPDNAQRHILNAWIKSTGATLPGVIGIADFETALADPTHPDFIVPNWNSGDNFHPDATGYQAQNASIPIALLAPR
jgi:hypothetical protein